MRTEYKEPPKLKRRKQLVITVHRSVRGVGSNYELFILGKPEEDKRKALHQMLHTFVECCNLCRVPVSSVLNDDERKAWLDMLNEGPTGDLMSS